MRYRLSVVALVLSLASSTAPAVVVAQDDGEPALVVVTTEVLGSLVSDLVADSASVTVLMSGGADPHAWQPSARDSEAIYGADLVVANGLDLEEGLVDILHQAADEGVRVFHATDHVDVRSLDGTEHGDDADHDHATDDPHFWLDPLAMRDVVEPLSAALTDIGIDLSEREATLVAALESLDEEVASILAVVPEADRKLVTGHDSLGYFADRYGLEVIGTVIPGRSTSAEPSAREVAQLVADVRAAGAVAVFAEEGTPQSVADAVAADAGARVVELEVVRIPEGGTYADLLIDLAQRIADALV